MAVSKKQQACVNKYMRDHYDRINFVVEQGKKEIIKAAAERRGMSTNAFINAAVDAALAQDAKENCSSKAQK